MARLKRGRSEAELERSRTVAKAMLGYALALKSDPPSADAHSGAQIELMTDEELLAEVANLGNHPVSRIVRQHLRDDLC